jgi:hypothetical protein
MVDQAVINAGKCKGKWPDQPLRRRSDRQGSGSRPHRQPGLPKRGKSAKIRATSGRIRGIPAFAPAQAPESEGAKGPGAAQAKPSQVVCTHARIGSYQVHKIVAPIFDPQTARSWRRDW